MSETKIDFIGFTFNNIHSSELGILRTSNGARFDEPLFPSFKDKTIEIPGRDGEIYLGTEIDKRQIKIPFAFAGITEKQKRQLSIWLGDKRIHKLIFDEAPYKYYLAKVSSSSLKTICLDLDNGRGYYGEGEIVFTCLYPYAQSVWKFQEEVPEELLFCPIGGASKIVYQILEIGDESTSGMGTIIGTEEDLVSFIDEAWLNDSGIDTMTNVSRILPAKRYTQWMEASGLPSQEQLGWILKGETFCQYKLNNVGDEEIFFNVLCKKATGSVSFKLSDSQFQELSELNVNFSSVDDNDEYLLYDFKRELIVGLDKNYQATGRLYNDKITAGKFFKIPKGVHLIRYKSDAQSLIHDTFNYNYIYY